MPNGVRDYLERGTTPAELAEAECAAAADLDGGRGYEAAVRRQAQVQPRPVLRLENPPLTVGDDNQEPGQNRVCAMRLVGLPLASG